jgi:hypothetical protein
MKALVKTENAKKNAVEKEKRRTPNMKSRIALSVLFVLMAASAFAADVTATQSDAQKSFDKLKTLAGEWEGPASVAEMPAMSGAKMHMSLRVTSRGHVLVHELQEAGTPLDATKYDHPVTMVYLDRDQLTLIHYCDAGNRPRMTGKMSPDGKTVEFELKDISGDPAVHMHHAVFTLIDANHHSEDWTFKMNDKLIHAHFDMQRTN